MGTNDDVVGWVVDRLERDLELRRLLGEFERIKMFDEGDVWTVQPDDMVGGWVVTDHPYPMSEHDHRPDGDPEKRGYRFAWCIRESDAWLIASLLNRFMVMRPDA